MHAPVRRPRTQPTPTGKRLELTKRDFKIFLALAQYRYLSSAYLHAFVRGASETRFKERLGDLFHEGFIDRPAKQWEIADARSKPAIHELGARGRATLAEQGGGPDNRTYLAATAHQQFRHATMICACLASIELAVRDAAGLRFIPWLEILSRAPEATRDLPMPFRGPSGVIPDGLFGLEYVIEGEKAYRFFALEADRATMPVMRSDERQTSYLGKLATYREVIDRQLYRSHWGFSKLFVLTVTTDPQRLANIIAKFAAVGGSPFFLFKAASERDLRAPMPNLLLGPWQRAGQPGLDISRP